MDVMAEIVKFLGVMLAVTAGVWGTTEALCRTPGLAKIPNVYVAILLGPLAGLVAHGAGWLAAPKAGGWAYAFAALMGLLCTFGAKGINDRLNPLGKAGPRRRAAAAKSRLPK